ncbi:Cell division protein FtsI [Leptospirillum ferriphilum]|uniref:Cell division protein FtsI n=2 Tax=Leptospirillum TaxID=179 RepID=A0A094YME2_9BACT|nr:penicillin-binding protein 2 [Leptospirillum ferriphilum]EDZ38620.1 MAG: Peptidoglycan glycosyltransferase [Leptospirillum sp. Group II '5-way CG']KGA94411.1 Cell division protein FtsI [Leptospirillum ferriphilum]
MKTRTQIVVLCVMVGFLAVSLRLMNIQFLNRSLYQTASLKEHQRFLQIHGERGTILDRQDHFLVSNQEVPSLVADPILFRTRLSPKNVSARLSPILKVSRAKLEHLLRKHSHFVWIRHGLTKGQAEWIRSHPFPGLFLTAEEKRFYPEGLSSHSVLGSTGTDNSGVSGLEKRYDGFLSGRRGGRILEVSARGRSYFSRDQVSPKGLQGDTVYTTLDGRIQRYAQNTLDEQVSAFDAEGGVVLVMDPWSGAILAMATNNRRMGGGVNPATSMVYEPGSVFKLVTASAALNEHRVTTEERFDGHNGVFYIPGGALHDDEPSQSLTLAQILAKSSNIGISQVALRVGPSLFYKYIQSFGFGQKTGLDFPGESAGIVHPPSRWSHRSIYSLAMGQEVGVTPLQIVTAVSAIANGGHLMQPYLVRKITDAEGHTIFRRKPRLVRRVITAETSRTLLDLMRNVVAPGGTGVKATIDGYDIAGKTGTAQVYDPSKHAYTRKQTIDSFVGVLPADHPSLVILAVVVKPRKISWGGTVAAPLFRKVAEMALVRFRIPSEKQPERKDHSSVDRVVDRRVGSDISENIK